MKEKNTEEFESKYLATDEIAQTFVPPRGWEICSGSGCGKPVPSSQSPTTRAQCVASSNCSGNGCECRLFRGKSNYPDNGYTWEFVADAGEWGSIEDGYWYICVCTKRA